MRPLCFTRGRAGMTRIVVFLFSGFGFRWRVDPEFHPDVGELLGIGEPAVTHHRPQRGQAGGVEEQARQPSVRIERHEPAVKQALRRRSKFGGPARGPVFQVLSISPSATVGSVVK